MNTDATAVSETRVGVRGTAVRVLRAGGEGREAVVFVHGNPGSADDWRTLLPAAGGLLPAVATDLPDFGTTAAPADFAHEVPAHAGFLDELLATLSIERVHLVLHDFGGPIGLVWAAGHLDRLVSVTLIDTGILPGYRWHRMARIWRTPVLGELFQATTTRTAFRRTIGRGEPRGLPRSFLNEMYDHYDRRTRRAVLRLYRATDDPGTAAPLLSAALAARDVPALVIWGEQDAYLPARYAERQREVFPSAAVHVLPASGHWPFVDASETVERLLLELLSGPKPGKASSEAAADRHGEAAAHGSAASDAVAASPGSAAD